MSKRIHELTAAGALTGTEPAEISQLSASVTLTATTISFAAADNSINDSGGGLIAAGFVAGKSINVTGAVDGANNLYSARITVTGLTASKMIIAAPEGDAIVDGSAGPSITITQWDSKRTTLQDIADLAGAGDASAVTYTPTTLADWNSSADPGNADDAFDQLAERVKDLETASPAAPDASVVTYTPADTADWNGSTDPGDVDQALDQLAQRVKDVETASSADTSGSPITYSIDTGSTADSDPGAGLLKFDNATQSAATTLYIDNATADAVTLTTYLASLAQTGSVSLVQSDDPSVWRVYKITAVTAASGYYKLTVVNQAGAGSFADDALVRLAFAMGDSRYSIGFGFTTTPTASEILFLHTPAIPLTLPDDFAGSVGKIRTNPTSSLVLDVQKNGSSVGTVTISTSGVFTFVTTGSTVSLNGTTDELAVVGPVTPDATAANASITFLGAK